MDATKQKQTRPKTGKRGKYAKARVSAGLTYRALTALGFGMATVARADQGHLPRNRSVRAEYLRALGLAVP